MITMTNTELLSEAHRIKAARAVALKMENVNLIITDGDTDGVPSGHWVTAALFISDEAIDAHMISSNPDYLGDRMEAWKEKLK